MKKKIEFSKILAIICTVLIILSCVISSVLSLLDKNANESVTTTLITVCGGYLVSYAFKSGWEKNSRNKYGIDENGIPYEIKGDTEE